MGTFTSYGIGSEIDKIVELIKGTDEACEKAVKAGAKVLVLKLKANAPVYKGGRRDVKPGALRDSIKAGKVKYWYADGYHCDVGPVGKDHGEDLGRIGNILEYGRSGARAERRARYTKEEKKRRKAERKANRAGNYDSHLSLEYAQKQNANYRVKEEVTLSKYYSNMDARGWFNGAIAGAEDEVIQAMRNAFNEAQKHE